MPGAQELLVIAVIALLVFGPERLPTLARDVGRLVARFRQETRRNVDELRQAGEVQQLQADLAELRGELRRVRRDLTGTTDPRGGRRTGSTGTGVTGGGRASGAGGAPPFDPEAP